MPKIYAIADLHLSNAVPNKAMDVFGAAWERHTERLTQAWRDAVKEEDLVLVPGDISWAMHLQEAEADFSFLASLPGKKLLLRGNHDYWWQSVTKVRNALPEGMYALQNDAFRFHDVEIAGTRGWTLPGSGGFKKETDQPIYERELQRLQLSLAQTKKESRKLVMLHYPPLGEGGTPSGFTDMLEPYTPEAVLYGHLHGAKAHAQAFEGERNGIRYALVAADYLRFVPKQVAETEPEVMSYERGKR